MVSGGMTDCCEELGMIYCPHVSIECSYEWDAAKRYEWKTEKSWLVHKCNNMYVFSKIDYLKYISRNWRISYAIYLA